MPDLLEFAGLGGKGDARIQSLSGGMKRRLAVARALVSDPDIVFLDEPTTGLDPQARHLIWDRLKQLTAVGKTLLLTTHFMDEAERLCDRIAVMDRGTIVATGAPRDLIRAHIEPEVVEVHGDGVATWADATAGLAERRERVGETVFCYARDAKPLLADLEGRTALKYLHRPANLEDVFLKLTGGICGIEVEGSARPVRAGLARFWQAAPGSRVIAGAISAIPPPGSPAAQCVGEPSSRRRPAATCRSSSDIDTVQRPEAMLFNSFAFLFVYLPVVVAGYFAIGRANRTAAAAWLAIASFVFYGWWDWRYLPLLLASIGVNYLVGRQMAGAAGRARKTWLVSAIVADLALLGYFKYANFFVSSAATLTGADWHIAAIALPIGISFFTFTQIAFLVDTYQGKVKEFRLIHYALFVTYFPHLVAGPVLHHKEMMPQFADPANYSPRAANFAIGLSIFTVGLAKKVLIADHIATLADPVFAPGANPAFIEAWMGALAYSLQLYFDFSGYSDMAIGLARMFNIRFPANFHSPYKAVNIADFWRRWHMTLSRFLRDYLYIALGGNRAGTAHALPQPHAHHAAGRPVARRGLDLHHLGRAPRRVPGGATPVVGLLQRPRIRPAAARGLAHHHAGGDGGLGLFQSGRCRHGA